MFCNNINLHKWTNMINAFATKIIMIHKIAPVRICISLRYTSYYCRYSIRLPIRLWFDVSWDFTQDHGNALHNNFIHNQVIDISSID